MSMAIRNSRMLAANWNAGSVMPITLKIAFPAAAKTTSTPAATQQASRAIRNFAGGGSLGVIAINAGTIAIGSRITKIDVTANKVYSPRVIARITLERNTRKRHSVFD